MILIKKWEIQKLLGVFNMRYLKFKGILFDSFVFGDTGAKENIFENTKRENLEGLDEGSAYICRSCVDKYGFEEHIENKIWEKRDYICCVKGCINKNAVEIYFDHENSELI